MPIGDEAINVFMAMPGEDPRLELTYNHGVTDYDHGTGYNHIALGVEDLDATLERLATVGIEPEKPPYRPGGRTEEGDPWSDTTAPATDLDRRRTARRGAGEEGARGRSRSG